MIVKIYTENQGETLEQRISMIVWLEINTTTSGKQYLEIKAELNYCTEKMHM